MMFRLTAPVYAKVWEAAEANGRSLSEELEHRIAQSFVTNDVVTAAAIAASTAVREAFASEKRLSPQTRAAQVHIQSLGTAVAKHLRHLNVGDESALFINDRPPDKWPRP